MKNAKKRMTFKQLRSTRRRRRVVEEGEVLRKLESPEYRFRTAEGIARSLDVEVETVRKVLQANQRVVKLARRTVDGREVYSTRERYHQVTTLSERLRGALINRVY